MAPQSGIDRRTHSNAFKAIILLQGVPDLLLLVQVDNPVLVMDIEIRNYLILATQAYKELLFGKGFFSWKRELAGANAQVADRSVGSKQR